METFGPQCATTVTYLTCIHKTPSSKRHRGNTLQGACHSMLGLPFPMPRVFLAFPVQKGVLLRYPPHPKRRQKRKFETCHDENGRRAPAVWFQVA